LRKKRMRKGNRRMEKEGEESRNRWMEKEE
jgi:hypothetical protein